MNKTPDILISLVLVGTTSLLAQPIASESSPEFTFNQLESSINNVFVLIDADENGSITLEEIDLLREDSNEPLSLEELALRRRRLGLINHYFWTDEEINRFEIGDSNSDGSLTREEFDNLSANIRTRRLELGLQELDSNKNGSVETNEFTAHIAKFEEWDSDGDGSLNRREIAGIEDRRVQVELHRPVFERRLEEVMKYLAAERAQRAAVAAGKVQDTNRRLPPIFANGPDANIDDLREASKNVFNLLDANDSGAITLDEIDIADELTKGEEYLPSEKLAELRQRSEIISYTFLRVEETIDSFEIADSNHNGTLSETEFDLMGTAVRTHVLQLNLDSFDTDNSSSVVFREFSAHLDNIEEFDTDGDGHISPKEMRGVSDFRLNMDVHVYQSNAFEQTRESEAQPQARTH